MLATLRWIVLPDDDGAPLLEPLPVAANARATRGRRDGVDHHDDVPTGFAAERAMIDNERDLTKEFLVDSRAAQ